MNNNIDDNAAGKFIGNFATINDKLKNKKNGNNSTENVVYVEVKPETKSKRFPLLIQPSKFEKLEGIASKQPKGQRSVNLLLNKIIDEYLESENI